MSKKITKKDFLQDVALLAAEYRRQIDTCLLYTSDAADD